MPGNSEVGTLGKQGREGPRAQILKRRSQKEGALAVSHRLAHNDTGVWVCERERVQARMGVCVCVIAGVHACLEGGPSQDVSLGHTGGNRAPWPESSGLRLKPIHRDRCSRI